MANRFEDDEPWETTVEEIQDMQITASLIPRGGTWVKYEDLEPIPLTPEWLGRCGFKIETIPDSVDDEGDIIKGYTHWTNGKFCFHFSDGKVDGRDHIQSVHLLQNWYYFNTGEELTINGLP